RLLAVGVDFRAVTTFEQPDDQWPKNVAEEVEEQSEKRAGMTENTPGADVGRSSRTGRWNGFHVVILSHVRCVRQARLTFHRDAQSRGRYGKPAVFRSSPVPLVRPGRAQQKRGDR